MLRSWLGLTILNLKRKISCKINVLNRLNVMFTSTDGWKLQTNNWTSRWCSGKSPQNVFRSAVKLLLIKSRPTGENFIQVENNLDHWEVFGTERCITSRNYPAEESVRWTWCWANFSPLCSSCLHFTPCLCVGSSDHSHRFPQGLNISLVSLDLFIF